MYWTDEPATEQQLLHLKDLGFKLARPLMRTEAARLIRELRRHPGRPHVETWVAPRPAESVLLERESPPLPVESGGRGLSESARMHAHRLRLAVESAQRALVANPNGPNARADAIATLGSRREFWLDTCREAKEMRQGSMQVMELHQAHGCRFATPSQQQAQDVLDALDSASATWDRDHPELFFQTLELNFPHLLRRA